MTEDIITQVNGPKGSSDCENETKSDASAAALSVDEAFDLTGHGKYNYLVLLACCFVSMAVATELFAYSLIAVASSCDLKLTISQKGLLSSIPYTGLFFSYLWGNYADTCGRRKAIIWINVLGFIFAFLSSFSPNWYTMLILKIVGCSCSTNGYSIALTYLGESAGSKYKNFYIQIMNCVNLGTDVIFFAQTYLILNLSFNLPLPWLYIEFRPWRLLAIILAMPMALAALTTWILYESPAFLANKGDEQEALHVMIKIYEMNNGKNGTYSVRRIKTNKQLEQNNFWISMATNIKPLFQKPLLWRTLQMFVLMLVASTTNNAFFTWIPVIVNNFFISFEQSISNNVSFCNRIAENMTLSHLTSYDFNICNDSIADNTLFSGMALGIYFVTANFIIAKLANWRKLFLYIAFLGSTVGCLLINWIHHPIANLLFFGLILGTALCVGSIGSYFVDFFPVSNRALVTSLTMMIARLGAFAGVNFVGIYINAHCQGTFYFWSVFVFSGIILTVFLPSEKQIEDKK